MFSAVTYSQLPPNLKRSDSLRVWLAFFKKTLDIPVNSGTPESVGKLKLKASKIIYRFIQHHANPKYDQQYSEEFLGRYAVGFLESCLLQLLAETTFPNKHKLYKYSMLSIPYYYKYPPCQKLLDDYRDKIISVILKRSVMDKNDLELWVTDPVEFIHKEKDSRKEVLDVIRIYKDSPQMVVAGLMNVLKNASSSDIEKEIYLYMFA